MNLLIMVEITVRSLAIGWEQYIRKCANLLDLAVLMIGAIMLFFYGVADRVNADSEEDVQLIGEFAVFVRTAVQVVRLGAVIKTQTELEQSSNGGEFSP